MKFNKVTIVGTGLLGGSLAKDLRALDLCESIVGVCRSETTKEQALEKGIVDAVLPIEEAVVDVDLIVFATPMQTMLSLIRQISNIVSPDTIITDVGSVKQSLYEEIKKQCPNLLSQFVFAHPIAGGEHSGVVAAKTGLFTGKHVIIADTPELNTDVASKVNNLWQQLGASVVKMGLLEHDAIFSKTSHLPHIVAFSLVNFLHNQTDRERLFEMAAAGFYDFTRIASSDAHMWRDICITNKEQVLSALDGYREQIDIIRKKISSENEQGVFNYFAAAKTARDDGLIKKKRLADQSNKKPNNK